MKDDRNLSHQSYDDWPRSVVLLPVRYPSILGIAIVSDSEFSINRFAFFPNRLCSRRHSSSVEKDIFFTQHQ